MNPLTKLHSIRLRDYLTRNNLKYLEELPVQFRPNQNYTYDIKVVYLYMGKFLKLRADTYWYDTIGRHYFSQGRDPNLRIEVFSCNYNQTWVILE